MKSEPKYVQTEAITPSQGVLNLACYDFDSNLWFAISDSMPVDAWPRAWDEPVESVWLFALPTPDRFLPLPNPWKLALKLRSGKVVIFGIIDCTLRVPKPSSPQVVVFYPYTDEGNPEKDIDRVIRNSVYTTGRRLTEGLRLKDIVHHINRTGDITNYTLLSSAHSFIGPRGRRFWINRVLERMRPFVVRKPGVQAFHREADHLMRHCWLPGKVNTGHFGYDDEQDNPLRIVGGADVLGGAFALYTTATEHHEGLV
ncbi:hypothetical protein F4811DRAFT_550574 [Daldinia bambusicola]|nr:hypothetical protein F4811DRAFT_550574 [Daldinia bambusicola]